MDLPVMPEEGKMRPKDDQNLWNFFFSIFFLAVFIAAIRGIYLIKGSFPTSIPMFDAVLMAFAAFRMTRLIVYDKITRWFRELFTDTKEIRLHNGEVAELHKHGHGIRHTMSDLLQCPWCIGFWSALIIVFCYLVFSWAYLVIVFLAIAGAGSLLQLWANVIGWKAEGLKLDALEKEIELKTTIDRSSLGN